MSVLPAAFFVSHPVPIKIIKSEVMMVVGGKEQCQTPLPGRGPRTFLPPTNATSEQASGLVLFFVLFMNK